MKHELKIWPEHYERVKSGSKTFEIRKNDRVFQKGDQVELLRWNPVLERYSEPTEYAPLLFSIGDVYPIDAERVVFSLLRLPQPPIELDTK
jgi:hypothetical protein